MLESIKKSLKARKTRNICLLIIVLACLAALAIGGAVKLHFMRRAAINTPAAPVEQFRNPLLNPCKRIRDTATLTRQWAGEAHRTPFWLGANQNATLPSQYPSPARAGWCRPPLLKRAIMFRLLKTLLRISAQFRLPWYISYGTLLGWHRQRDFLAHDHDIDLLMPAHLARKLRGSVTRSAVARQMLRASQLRFVFSPMDNRCGVTPAWNVRDCRGRRTLFQLDVCSFCTPVARLVHEPSQLFIDLFRWDQYACPPDSPVFRRMFQPHTHHKHRSNKSVSVQISASPFTSTSSSSVSSSSSRPNPVWHDWIGSDYVHHRHHNIYPSRFLLPLRTCHFMGLKLPCPRHPLKVLRLWFGTDLRPNLACLDGIWTHKLY